MTTDIWALQSNNHQASNGASLQTQVQIPPLPLSVEAESQPTMLRVKDTLLLGWRRAIARMIRVELEITLSILKQAIEQSCGSKPCTTRIRANKPDPTPHYSRTTIE